MRIDHVSGSARCYIPPTCHIASQQYRSTFHDTDSCSARSEVLVHGNGETQTTTGFWPLTLGSIGVVYGDIGTSPLYALREAVLAAVGTGGTATSDAVLGVLSLILWALIIVVTLKYVLILLRADNHGEGGTITLMALAQRAVGAQHRRRDALRHHQRGPVLRRRHDHAGALGAVRRRGPQSRNARLRSLHRAAHGGDPRCAICGPIARHREGRRILRSGDAGLVHRDCDRRLVAARVELDCARRASIRSMAFASF